MAITLNSCGLLGLGALWAVPGGLLGLGSPGGSWSPGEPQGLLGPGLQTTYTPKDPIYLHVSADGEYIDDDDFDDDSAMRLGPVDRLIQLGVAQQSSL